MLYAPAPLPAPDLPAPLSAALSRALQAPAARVQAVTAGDRVLWLKRAETLSLRWRLQKGDPQRALETERAALRDLGARGLPVARLVAEGPDYLVTEDAGTPLSHLLSDPAAAGAARPADLAAAFAAAGAALADLHRAGVAHGRPALRDICWDGHQARFIDLEAWRPGPSGPARMARDVLVLLHSVLVLRPDPGPELAAALAGWQRRAPAGLWPRVQRQAAALGLLRAPVRLLLRLRPRTREFAAALVLIDWLTAQRTPPP